MKNEREKLDVTLIHTRSKEISNKVSYFISVSSEAVAQF